MPNKCARCGKLHLDNADYILKGCDACGGKFFFYVREEQLERMEKELENLTPVDIKEMETDVRDIVSEKAEEEDTVILDLEAISILRPGKYAIDVTTLFTQRPIVIKVGPGKYELDLSTLMAKWKKRLKRK